MVGTKEKDQKEGHHERGPMLVASRPCEYLSSQLVKAEPRHDILYSIRDMCVLRQKRKETAMSTHVILDSPPNFPQPLAAAGGNNHNGNGNRPPVLITFSPGDDRDERNKQLAIITSAMFRVFTTYRQMKRNEGV